MKYLIEEIGDATEPLENSTTLIVHCVNNAGLWGSGFVIPLGEKFPKARDLYRKNFKNYSLGDVQQIKVADKVFICNLFGQNGIKSSSNPTPIDYDKFFYGLSLIYKNAPKESTILMPAIGSDRAGGDWNLIKSKIEEYSNKYQVKTIVRYIK